MRPNPVSRVACALRLVESRPTADGARFAQRGLGVVVLWVIGQRGARSSPRRRLGLDRTNTATGRRYGLQEVFVAAFESHGTRRARSSPRGESADRPRSTRRAAGTWQLGVVVLWPIAGRAPPYVNGRALSAPTPRQVGGTAFGRCWSLRSNPVACVACALRPLESRPTADGSRAAQHKLGDLARWLCCGPTRSALPSTPSASARPHQHRGMLAARPSRAPYHRIRIPWRASRALFVPWRTGRPPKEHAPRSGDLATWRGCVMGQRGARSTSRRRAGLDRTNTETGRRYSLR